MEAIEDFGLINFLVTPACGVLAFEPPVLVVWHGKFSVLRRGSAGNVSLATWTDSRLDLLCSKAGTVTWPLCDPGRFTAVRL